MSRSVAKGASSDREVRLSIGIVTRNRPDFLAQCLHSFRTQSFQPFEIIVSDDSDSERYSCATAVVCGQWHAQHLPGPRRGLYANRNSILEAFNGTHILMSDDDHTHPKGYVEQVMECVRSDPDRIWIFGERVPQSSEMELCCPPEMDATGHFVPPKDPSNCCAIADGAAVYPRDLVERGLRYDTSYGFGPLYYLWGHELVSAGYRITFCDRTFVWHHCTISENRTNHALLTECYLYVLWVNARRVRGFRPFVWALSRSLIAATIGTGEPRRRISLLDARAAFMNAFSGD